MINETRKADAVRALDNCMLRIGHHFSQPNVLLQSLTHRSFTNEHNERLEFLGDGILNFLVAEALYQRFPQAPEGVLTRMRAKLVREETLAELAIELNLGECLRLGSGELKSGGFRRASTLADAFEAVIAAIYLDAGMEPARTFVIKLLASRFEGLDATAMDKDPKTRLQEWCQSKAIPLPIYSLVQQSGEAHALMFEVSCQVKDIPVTHATANSRRKAEQSAASEAFAYLQAQGKA
jgi:ribonuclease-3